MSCDTVPGRDVRGEPHFVGERTIRLRPLEWRCRQRCGQIVRLAFAERFDDRVPQSLKLEGGKLAHQDDVDEVFHARARLVVAVAARVRVHFLRDVPLKRDG